MTDCPNCGSSLHELCSDKPPPPSSDVGELVEQKPKLKAQAIEEGLFEIADWMDDAAAMLQAQAEEIERLIEERQANFILANEKIAEIAALTEKLERYQAAMSRLYDHDPQLVDAVRNDFDLQE